MERHSYKTQSANSQTIEKKWFTVDGENQIVGRLASRIASRLRGKHKTSYTPHVDCGDHIIILNAGKVIFTANKEESKEYVSHTGYPGGQKITTPARMRAKDPLKIIHMAIKRMLPKNKLSRQVIKKLHLCTGTEHNHQAQNPQPLTFN